MLLRLFCLDDSMHAILTNRHVLTAKNWMEMRLQGKVFSLGLLEVTAQRHHCVSSMHHLQLQESLL